MPPTTFTGMSHLDLSVSDRDASVEWYRRVLGFDELHSTDSPPRTTLVMETDTRLLIIGLIQHDECPDERFDERRPGLDHVGFGVPDRADLDRWQTHLADLEVTHSPVTDGEFGSIQVLRDPDNIQLEIWWANPAHFPDEDEEAQQ